MESLKGKTILVGKEPNGSRLLMAVDGKVMAVANGVPNSVSRLMANEVVAHCKLEVVDGSHVRVTNLKPQNVTRVNNVEIVTKTVERNTQLQLGKDRYSVSVDKLIKSITGSEISIAHLKPIWENYEEERNQINKKNHDIQTYQRFPMIFTMGSGALSALAGSQGWPKEVLIIASIMTVAGFILLLYMLYLAKSNNPQEQLKELREDFENKYVCPNCHHFLGDKKYKILIQDGRCVFPNCGAKWKEKV